MIEANGHASVATFLSLIKQWRSTSPRRASSPEWEKLSTNTKVTWNHELNRITEKWGDVPLTVFNDPRMTSKVVAWRNDRSLTPRAADMGVTVLKALLDYGRLSGKLLINVAVGVPQLYSGGDRQDIIWTDDDVRNFAALAPQRITDGLLLASVTGLRRADLVALKWSEVGEHAIIRTASKKSRGKRRRAVVPLIPDAHTLLAELRGRLRADGVDTVLVDSRGNSWNATSFSAQFNACRDQAQIAQPANEELGIEAKKKHLHDVRGTFCTHLCRSDLSNEEIGRIMAWSPQQVENIRRTYVDDAAVVVALARRIGSSTVKQPVKNIVSAGASD